MTTPAAQAFPAGYSKEDWKHVSPEDFLIEGAVASEAEVSRLVQEWALPEAWSRLVFVGGRFRAELSLVPPSTATWSIAPASAPVGPSAEVGSLDPADHPILAGFPDRDVDGIRLAVAAGATLPGPVQIVEIASGSSWLRHAVSLGASAQATVVETHASPGGTATSSRSVLEVDLPSGAKFEHARFQLEAPDGRAWSALLAKVADGAALAIRHLGLGAGIARCELHVDLAGPGADLAIEGLAASQGQERFDAFTSVKHLARDCTSRQLWKSLARDRSVGSYTGGILVAEGADGTSATQSSRNVILSREAAIHSLPKLRIWADDVKCSHGSATGRLDEKALFFLRSRGLSALDARKLLVKAFADEVLDHIPWESTRSRLSDILGSRI